MWHELIGQLRGKENSCDVKYFTQHEKVQIKDHYSSIAFRGKGALS